MEPLSVTDPLTASLPSARVPLQPRAHHNATRTTRTGNELELLRHEVERHPSSSSASGSRAPHEQLLMGEQHLQDLESGDGSRRSASIASTADSLVRGFAEGAAEGALEEGVGEVAGMPNTRAQAAIEFAIERVGRFWIFIMVALVFGMIGVLFYSELVYDTHHNDQCDQPLAFLLRMLYILIGIHTFQKEVIRFILCYSLSRDGPDEPRRVILFRRATIVATLLWPLSGAWMLGRVRKCSSELQGAVLLLVCFYALFLFVAILLPVMFIIVLLILMRRGIVPLPRSRDAAPADLIHHLPQVEYDSALFDGGQRGGHSVECLICLENFDASKSITRTTCLTGRNGHVFHTDCLKGWLEHARTCPLCRTDLTLTEEAQGRTTDRAAEDDGTLAD